MTTEADLRLPTKIIVPEYNSDLRTDQERSREFETLDMAMALTRVNKNSGTVVTQLGDTVNLSASGLVLTHGHTRETDALLPPYLVYIWERLSDPTYVDLYKEWVTSKIAMGQDDESLLLLITLANFSYLFNTHPESNNEHPCAHPLNALYHITEAMRENIPEGYENTAALLKHTNDAIFTRIHSYLLTNGHSTIERPFSLESSSNHLKDWLIFNLNLGKSDVKALAESAVSFMQASGFRDAEVINVLNDYANSGDFSSEFVDMIKAYAIRVNLLQSSVEEVQQALRTTINDLEKNPFQDAAEIDYAELIQPETEILRIYTLTGTFLAHNGQAALIRKVLRYIENNQGNRQSEETQPTCEFILILPNLIPGIGKDGKPKDLATSGTVEQRVSLLLLHLSDLDRKKVLITTALQPHPSESLRGRVRVGSAINRLNAKIVEDFGKATPRRLPKYQIEVVRFTGADELAWDTSTGEAQLMDQQHPRYSRYAEHGLVVARHEHAIPCLKNSPRIVRDMNCDLIILDDPSSAIGSTASLARYHATGDLRSFTPSAWPLLQADYNQDTIDSRRLEGFNVDEMQIPSVTEIDRKTVQRLKQLTELYQS